jgi:energy-coupling factor transporter transmembrane protein EcfT
MDKFLLPFQEGNSKATKFSPTGMLLAAVAIGVLCSLQDSPIVVLVLYGLLLLGGAVSHTRWRVVFSLVTRFELIILFWVFLEPLLYGTTAIYVIATPWGPLNVYLEGLELGILLGLRMMFLLTLFGSTLSHMSLVEFIGALRTLRVPVTVLGSLMIMLRYIPLFISERSRMQDALSLRGLERGTRRSKIQSLGFMVGSSIDRAFDRSVAVYDSMTLRGFGHGMVIRGAGVRRADAALLSIVLFLFLGLLLVFPILLEVIVL